MKIEIVTGESGKKEVNGDFATVVKDTMFEKTHFGESVVGDTVQVMGFVPKGATILVRNLWKVLSVQTDTSV